MSIYDFAFPVNGNNASNTLLQQIGPVIQISVSAPDALAQLLTTNSQPIPSPVFGLGIIDTGAVTSCVNKSILQGLGGSPVGSFPFSTPGATVNLDAYPAKIEFPGTDIARGVELAVGMEDMHSSYQGQDIIALIGRDVLSGCILIYNGKTGIYTLTH